MIRGLFFLCFFFCGGAQCEGDPSKKERMKRKNESAKQVKKGRMKRHVHAQTRCFLAERLPMENREKLLGPPTHYGLE